MEAEPPSPVTAGHRRADVFVRAVGGMAAVNAATMLVTFVSGPLQARVLGPTGRGELAAIVAITGIAPYVFGLGLNAFVARHVARGDSTRALLGTVTALSLLAGVLSWIVAWPIAAFVADGRETVRALVLVGFLLLPLTITAITLLGAAWGREQWRRLATWRLYSQAAVLVVYVVLAVAGELTVTSAAIVVLLMGFVACAPGLSFLRGARAWVVRRTVAADAMSFGFRGSLYTIAQQSNARLDQIFMAGLVSARELGYYVVAVTFASLGMLLVVPLSSIMLPTVAKGDSHAVKAALRMTLGSMTALSLVFALAAPVAVELLFGSDFARSGDLVRVLVIGTVLMAGNYVLSSSFAGDGKPGKAATAELIAVGFTVPLLLAFLPRHGAMAAAVISVVAYGVSFGYLLVQARRWLGGPLRDLLLPRRTDVAQLAGAAGRLLARRRR